MHHHPRYQQVLEYLDFQITYKNKTPVNYKKTCTFCMQYNLKCSFDSFLILNKKKSS